MQLPCLTASDEKARAPHRPCPPRPPPSVRSQWALLQTELGCSALWVACLMTVPALLTAAAAARAPPSCILLCKVLCRVFPWPCRALQSPRALRTGQQSPKDRANQLSGAVRLLFCSCLSDRKTVGPHMASTELGTITIELPRQRSSCCVPWNTGVLRITCKCAVIKWKTAFKSYGK